MRGVSQFSEFISVIPSSPLPSDFSHSPLVTKPACYSSVQSDDRKLPATKTQIRYALMIKKSSITGCSSLSNISPYISTSLEEKPDQKAIMAQKQSGKSFRSFLGVPPSKPTPKDSVLVIVDAQNEYGKTLPPAPNPLSYRLSGLDFADPEFAPDHGLLAISDVKASRAVIGDVLGKYRDAKGDVVHVKHETPDGAPLFTPGTELAQEFSELSHGGDDEKVSFMICKRFDGVGCERTVWPFGKGVWKWS